MGEPTDQPTGETGRDGVLDPPGHGSAVVLGSESQSTDLLAARSEASPEAKLSPQPDPPSARSPKEPTGPRQPASYLFFTVISVVSAGLDLGTKAWATKNLTGFDPVSLTPKKIILIQGYLDFQYAQNPGGAWSMLHTLPEIGRRPFFLMVSTVASVFIAAVYGRIDRRQWAMRWGLPLALGGAIGNLVDRIRNGWVVDFVHFWFKKKVGEYHWPTFNVADVWIVMGVALMAIDLFASRRVRASLPDEADGADSLSERPGPPGQAPEHAPEGGASSD